MSTNHQPTDPTRNAATPDEAAGPYCACGRTAIVIIETRYERVYYECPQCHDAHLDAGEKANPINRTPADAFPIARRHTSGGRLTDVETTAWIDTDSDAHFVDLEAAR